MNDLSDDPWFNAGDRPNCVIRVPAKDSYSTNGEKIMGRQSANEGFLRAWFLYSGHKEFFCLTRFRNEAQVFADIGSQIHPNARENGYAFRWFAQMQIHHVAIVGTAFLPGPQVAQMAWIRRRNGICKETDFSLVGMTHTTCELAIQDNLADMLTAPVYEWDAQICPSQSVRTMVARLLDDEATWLAERFTSPKISLPQLPVLPLGVHTRQFDLPEAEHLRWREVWRARWQMTEDEVTVLYMGRLDLQSKVNLFPMFDALERAAMRLAESGSGIRLNLVVAGWFASEWNERVIREGAVQVCPHVRVIFEDGRAPEVREGVWHAVDVFTSLVDNIQETFGLTPIEAMAAGLPVVVTDYDGYKESVREGLDGFKIRTWQPAPGSGLDMVDRHDDMMEHYFTYAGRASWMVGVDIEQATQAYVQLAQSPLMRQTMGAQARQRAMHYEWKSLIPQYQTVFAELAKIRQEKASQVCSSWLSGSGVRFGQRYPRRSDPFHSFSHYPTQLISLDLHIALSTELLRMPFAQWRTQLNLQLSRPVYEHSQEYLNPDVLWSVIEVLNHAQTSLSLAAVMGVLEQSVPRQHLGVRMHRQIGWLIKSGLIQPVV